MLLNPIINATPNSLPLAMPTHGVAIARMWKDLGTAMSQGLPESQATHEPGPRVYGVYIYIYTHIYIGFIPGFVGF